MIIFVYGTLLKGLERESVLTNSRYMGPVMIQAELFDLGYYPGTKEGKGTVVGELYEVNKEIIDALDRIKGYNESNIADSLFVRKEVEACKFADGELVNAFCYFYNHSIKENIIFYGDYRRYILEKENEYQWILAYGSNISSNRLFRRVGEIKEYKSGFIDGFELVFNKKAYRKQTVYANIAYAGHGERCPAVAYKLSPEQVSILDQCEGVPEHYLRITTLFCDNSGDKSITQAYIAHPDRLVWGQSPERVYLDYIQRGYQEHGFDISYLKDIIK